MTRAQLIAKHLLYTLAFIVAVACFWSVFMGLADFCGQALNDKEILMSEVWRTMAFAFRLGLIYYGPAILLMSFYDLWGRIKYQRHARN